MVKVIGPNIFHIELPFPDSPLGSANVYVLKADRRNLVIDTGPKHPSCEKSLLRAVNEIGLDRDKTDLFITHIHSDHYGLVPILASPKSKIYFNRYEAQWYKTWEGFEGMARYFMQHGFPESAVNEGVKYFNRMDFSVDWLEKIESIGDGDQLDFGPFNLKCIHTPGHSRGHLCLFESCHQILFSGDHIISDISPSIMCWSDEDNPLKAYFASLNKIRDMDVRVLFPGHRGAVDDHRFVIDKIRRHHAIRLSEIMTILADGPLSAYQIAGKMRWKRKADTWDDFPVVQKLMATAEAIAHIRYLEELKVVGRMCKGDQELFFVGDSHEFERTLSSKGC